MSGRLSWPDVAEMMHMMTGTPRGAAELAAHFSLTEEGMRMNLRMLHACKLLRIVKWKSSGRGGHNWTALFVRGSGNDTPRPPFGQRAYPYLQPSAQIIAFASMWRELDARPHCPRTLAAACGTHLNRVYLLMARMRELGMLEFAGTHPSRPIRGGKPSTLWRLCGHDEGPAVHTPERLRYERVHAAKPRAANATIFTQAA